MKYCKMKLAKGKNYKNPPKPMTKKKLAKYITIAILILALIGVTVYEKYIFSDEEEPQITNITKFFPPRTPNIESYLPKCSFTKGSSQTACSITCYNIDFPEDVEDIYSTLEQAKYEENEFCWLSLITINFQNASVNKNWLKISNETHPNITKLEIRTSNLKFIGPESFSNFIHLEIFCFGQADLKHLSKKAFSGLINLKEFAIWEMHELTSIGYGFLSNFPKLEVLELRAVMPCSDSTIQAFANLTGNYTARKILTVDFRQNCLVNITKDILNGYPNAQQIYLESSGIKNFENGSLENVTSVRLFDFQNNKIATLPENVFRKFFENNKFLSNVMAWANEFICDCEMIWLQDYINEKGGHLVQDFKNIRCHNFPGNVTFLDADMCPSDSWNPDPPFFNRTTTPGISTSTTSSETSETSTTTSEISTTSTTSETSTTSTTTSKTSTTNSETFPTTTNSQTSPTSTTTSDTSTTPTTTSKTSETSTTTSETFPTSATENTSSTKFSTTAKTSSTTPTTPIDDNITYPDGSPTDIPTEDGNDNSYQPVEVKCKPQNKIAKSRIIRSASYPFIRLHLPLPKTNKNDLIFTLAPKQQYFNISDYDGTTINVTFNNENNYRGRSILWLTYEDGNALHTKNQKNLIATSCSTNISKKWYLIQNLEPQKSYLICVFDDVEFNVNLLDCVPHTTQPLAANQAWLTFGSKPFAIVILVVVSIGAFIVGSGILYFLVRKNPTLIKGSKKVIVVKRMDKQQVMIMPDGYKNYKNNSNNSNESSDVSNTDNCSVVSYISAIQPSPMELLAYRLERLREKIQEESKNKNASLSLPVSSDSESFSSPRSSIKTIISTGTIYENDLEQY